MGSAMTFQHGAKMHLFCFVSSLPCASTAEIRGSGQKATVL